MAKPRTNATDAPVPDSTEQHGTCVTLGGTTVQLMTFENAMSVILQRAQDSNPRPLGVMSANLDHVQHFGRGGRWHEALDSGSDVDWLTLVDGAPLRTKAKELTHQDWPRLAGSDLIAPILGEAALRGLRVGFLGGSPQTLESLAEQLGVQWPALELGGYWSPTREELSAKTASTALASEIAAAAVDILIVGLGKPRQELWISEYGRQTGAKVLLAFGAVVDFLAGRIRRAPQWLSDSGLEWGWRLSLEPSRLARRYLVDGPVAYRALRKHSHLGTRRRINPIPPVVGSVSVPSPERALTADQPADVVAIVVTHNNVDDVAPLMRQLGAEAAMHGMRVVVADNSSTDGTWETLQGYDDVIRVQTGGDFGHAAGVNLAMRHAGPAASYLIVNANLRLEPGAIAALWDRMTSTGAGIAVPQIVNGDGTTQRTLRREPSLVTALGDAVFGSNVPQRPDWSSEIDFATESYRYPHLVDWASSAAMLVRADAAHLVGDWDERFYMYSDWTDFFRRSRDLGIPIWYEPAAKMYYTGSTASPLDEHLALMAVNKVRYARKHRNRIHAAMTHVVVALAEVARSYQPRHRTAARAMLGGLAWTTVPHASGPVPAPTDNSVIPM